MSFSDSDDDRDDDEEEEEEGVDDEDKPEASSLAMSASSVVMSAVNRDFIFTFSSSTFRCFRDDSDDEIEEEGEDSDDGAYDRKKTSGETYGGISMLVADTFDVKLSRLVWRNANDDNGFALAKYSP